MKRSDTTHTPFAHTSVKPAHDMGEVNTRRVVWLTLFMMVLEIAAGTWSGSLALLADGWHMASHAGALGLAWFAYRFARSQSAHTRLSFGPGKVHALAGWSSAILLAVVALEMIVKAFERLLQPQPIAFREAIAVAVLGLVVNLLSAKILHAGHDHKHDHDHAHDQGHGHDHGHAPDANLQAAYLHVLADALTSLLAIAALACGALFGWTWLDAITGIVGAVVILRWSVGLLRSTSDLLLDATPCADQESAVRQAIEDTAHSHVLDLHIWDLAPGHRACIVAVASDHPLAQSAVTELIQQTAPFAHVTVHVEPKTASA